MRTTITIADEILRNAKRSARSRGLTLGELVETAVRRELAAADAAHVRPPIPVFREGTGPRPGVDLTSNRSLAELLDEPLDLDATR